MRIFAIGRRNPNRPPEDFAEHSVAEVKTVFGLIADGLVREIYSMADGGGAVLVCEADSVEAAREALADLPFYQNGLLDIEFVPVVGYRDQLDPWGDLEMAIHH